MAAEMFTVPVAAMECADVVCI